MNCPKRTLQPNWAQLRRKWGLTPDSVGVLYTGFQKKRTQRRSSGIAAKNWISEKKPETCELVCRNANIFTYRRTSLAHFLLFLRPICELHTLLGEITEKPLIISELSPKSDVQSIFTGFITLLDRGKLQYISEGITHSSWMILRVATGRGNKKEKWLSVFSATGNKKHDQYRKRCAILNSILAKCIPGYSLNGIRYRKQNAASFGASFFPDTLYIILFPGAAGAIVISIYVFRFVTRILFFRTIFSYWAKRASNRHETSAPHFDYLKSDNLRILAAALLWRVCE